MQYRVKTSPLYVKTKENLIRLIHDSSDDSNQLPSEEGLIRTMCVSRGTVREALVALSREGIVSKRPGLGNFFHRSALDYPMRIDLVYDFVDLLSRAGHQVAVRQDPFSVVNAPECTGETGEFLKVTWTYLAGAEAAILADMYVPRARLQGEPDPAVIERSLPEFLFKYCGDESVQSAIIMGATMPSPRLRILFKIAQDMPVIRWNEVYFNLSDEKVAYATVYFNPCVTALSMIRKDLG
ncbi:MAG: GntR family transcriptional regulator [Firmicutes bacterium]|nr:GntR family transcriptional regulator [Bacillota bacterium]